MQNESTGTEKVWGMSTTGRLVYSSIAVNAAVHQRVQPQHRSAASTMEARNMARFASMSPVSPGTWLKVSRR